MQLILGGLPFFVPGDYSNFKTFVANHAIFNATIDK